MTLQVAPTPFQHHHTGSRLRLYASPHIHGGPPSAQRRFQLRVCWLQPAGLKTVGLISINYGKDSDGRRGGTIRCEGLLRVHEEALSGRQSDRCEQRIRLRVPTLVQVLEAGGDDSGKRDAQAANGKTWNRRCCAGIKPNTSATDFIHRAGATRAPRRQTWAIRELMSRQQPRAEPRRLRLSWPRPLVIVR